MATIPVNSFHQNQYEVSDGDREFGVFPHDPHIPHDPRPPPRYEEHANSGFAASASASPAGGHMPNTPGTDQEEEEEVPPPAYDTLFPSSGETTTEGRVFAGADQTQK